MFQDSAIDRAYFARRANEERHKAALSDHPNVSLVHLQMAEEYIRKVVSLANCEERVELRLSPKPS